MRRFLLIDTANEPCTVALATARKPLAEASIADRRELSERLLRTIDALSSAAHLPLSELSGVGVVTGPGPFTALRIGVAVANAIAYAQSLPMVALPADRASSTVGFATAVAERIERRDTARAVLPAYGREPSITPPKSGKS